MKEYLDPKDWSLKRIKLLLDRVPSNWIEVPEGALFYARQPAGQFFYRRDERGRLEFWSQLCKTWFKSECPEIHLKPLWVRPTQPEELPFIDDEPPAHFVVRPKPRQRVYAVLGDPVPMTPAEAFASFAAQFGAFWRDLGAAAKKLRDEGKL